MQPGLDQKRINRRLAERLERLEPVVAFDQDIAFAVSPHADRRRLGFGACREDRVKWRNECVFKALLADDFEPKLNEAARRSNV